MTAPLRPAIYCRVSTTEQVEGYSLDQQERACRDYARVHGWGDPTLYVDAGRSAFTDVTEKRPQFAAMLDAAEAGEHDAILVHKLDRFSRSLVTTLRELQRLERAGVAFASVSEAMDFSTPIGRVILSVLGAFAEFYSRNLSTEVKKGLAGRKLAGKPPHSRPYGAMVDGDALAVDPAWAEHLARVLALAAEVSGNEAAARLNAEGVPSRHGGRWYGETVRTVVRRGAWLADQPPPWPARWSAAALGRHARPPVGPGRTIRLLTGLMRCGVCGGRVHYGPYGQGGKGRLMLQCNRAPDGPERCLPDAPRKTHAAHYEAAVLAWAAALPDEAELRRAAERLAARDDPALEELAAIREERERLEVAWIRGGVSPATHAALLADLDARERAAAPHHPGLRQVAAQFRVARDSLPDLPPEFANRILAGWGVRVTITGRAVAVEAGEELAALLAEHERAGRAVKVA